MLKRAELLLLVSTSLVVTGCYTLDYDLSSVPIPISAKPATAADGDVEPFEIEATEILWVHGLFGEREPDVAALVSERAEGYDRIVGFQVSEGSNFHQWLATHLSLTLVRMRSVTIEGQLVRDPSP